MTTPARWLEAAPLRSARLTLEPLRVEHASEAFEVLDDPRLHTYTGGEPASRDELDARFAHQVVGCSRDGSQGWLNIERRRACLEGLVADIAADCTLLTLESDETQDRRDRQDLALLTRRAGCHGLRYQHQSPYVEPLLWVPDAVGWAHARGREWTRLAAPMIRRVVPA